MLLVKCFSLFLLINGFYCSECSSGNSDECLREEISKLQKDLLPLTLSLAPNMQQYLPFGALESDWNRLLSLESMLPAGHPLRQQLTKSFLLLVKAVREALEHHLQQSAAAEAAENAVEQSASQDDDVSHSVEEIILDDILKYAAGSNEEYVKQHEVGTVVAAADDDTNESSDYFDRVVAEGLVAEVTGNPVNPANEDIMLGDMQYEAGATDKVITEDLEVEKKNIVDDVKVENNNEEEKVEEITKQDGDMDIKIEDKNIEEITEKSDVKKPLGLTIIKSDFYESDSQNGDALENEEIPAIDDEINDTTHINFPVIDEDYIIGDVEEPKINEENSEIKDDIVEERQDSHLQNVNMEHEEISNSETDLNADDKITEQDSSKTTESSGIVDLPKEEISTNSVTEIAVDIDYNKEESHVDIQNLQIENEEIDSSHNKENVTSVPTQGPYIENEGTVDYIQENHESTIPSEVIVENENEEIINNHEEPETTIPAEDAHLEEPNEEIIMFHNHEEPAVIIASENTDPENLKEELLIDSKLEQVSEDTIHSENIDLENEKEEIMNEKPEISVTSEDKLQSKEINKQELNQEDLNTTQDLDIELEELLTPTPISTLIENEMAIEEELRKLVYPALNYPTSDLPSFKILEGEDAYGIKHNEESELLQEEIQSQEHYPETTTNVNVRHDPYTTADVFGAIDNQSSENVNKVTRSTTMKSILHMTNLPHEKYTVYPGLHLKNLDTNKDIIQIVNAPVDNSEDDVVTEESLYNLDNLQYFTNVPKIDDEQPIIENLDNSMLKQEEIFPSNSDYEEPMTEVYVPESTTQLIMKNEDYYKTFPDFQNTESTIAEENEGELGKELMKQKESSPKWAKDVIYKYLEEKQKLKPKSLDKYSKYEKEINKLSMTNDGNEDISEDVPDVDENREHVENEEETLDNVSMHPDHNMNEEEIEEILEYSDGVKNLESMPEGSEETPLQEIKEEEIEGQPEVADEAEIDPDNTEEIEEEAEAEDDTPEMENNDDESAPVEEMEEDLEENEENLKEINEEIPAKDLEEPVLEAQEDLLEESEEEPVEEGEEELVEEESEDDVPEHDENEYIVENQSQTDEENESEAFYDVEADEDTETNKALLRNLDNSENIEETHSEHVEEDEDAYTTIPSVMIPPSGAEPKPKITVDTLDALNRIIFGKSYNPTKLKVHEITTKKPAPLLLAPLDPHRYQPIPKWDLKLLQPQTLVLPAPPPLKTILLPAPRTSRYAMDPPNAPRPEEDDLYRWFFSKFRAEEAQKVADNLKRGEDLPQFEFRGARVPYKVGDVYSGHH